MSENKNKKSIAIIPDERIIGKIYYLRGKKVMFDRDLAMLYDVETRDLNKAVKRNADRFPDDFMFQLSKEEFKLLMFHFGTSNKGRGGTRKLPFVFTEQGVAMLSSVLKSKRAIQVNIQIIRTFTKLREILSTHKDLQVKIEKMEKENGENFKVIFKIINKLIMTDPKSKELKIIGFDDKKK
ncbi:MAG: KilA-N, DNA-binding domain protein [Candidatus Moranbacteria bacterium GW2011_GWE1_35_17]|nr:MAG: KilA-N, DNA-binding domain protein [Candidatus Moranbacteria bacterium GW2011_GWE1_35_17]KKP71593.1 MAG: KilA-N, DNA-binding domain protein [Candidatus Moranbacteria bacterium GW2011_GWE2_35_164]KKP80781.1 MAG: KilA-N, DNA-binding domain protein [Candidatus Moranbacteria bacterium GW2011_GWF1_35_5]KKP84292.1 MAG: KilA-N, DNA-binding domain protein [Candidatus Moranbacteria bacterium GW2011_GWF2_35_54]